MNTKTCSKCGEDLPISEFTKDIYKSDGLCSSCKSCKSIQEKEYRRKNKDKIRKIQKTASAKYRKNNKDKIHNDYLKNKKKIYEYQKNYYKKNKVYISERSRKYKLRKKYKITENQVNKIREEQGNKCAICGVIESAVKMGGGKLCIDHNHKTGKVRGLLCGQCNSALGHFNESIEILNNAIEYIKKHESEIN
jgi:hypothetical protein